LPGFAFPSGLCSGGFCWLVEALACAAVEAVLLLTAWGAGGAGGTAGFGWATARVGGGGGGDTAGFGCATAGVGALAGVEHAWGAGVEVGLAGATGVDGDFVMLMFFSFCCLQMWLDPKTATPYPPHNQCHDRMSGT
jgi:hypothetical protein